MIIEDEFRTGHPVPAAVRALSDAVGDLAERPRFALDAAATRETLLELAACEAKLMAYKLAVAAHADQVEIGAEDATTSTGVWWALATRQTRRSAAGLVKTANALETRWTLVRRALAGAELNLDQARVIVRALEALPGEVGAEIVVQAEQTLVDLARVHDPDELRLLGERILTVVAPGVGEEADRKKLEEAERLARQRRRLTLSFDGHGSAHGRFTVPAGQGRAFEQLLMAFAAPGHVNATQGAGSWVKGRPTPQKLGEAFGELIETYPRSATPRHGGVSATVVVTVDLETLRSGLGHATLSTGDRISAAQARRLACEAGIIPVVLGAQSQVLDLGREKRLFDHHQLTALHLRDGACTAEGCDWPPGFCHAHHVDPWSAGGGTDLANARLLCPHHHARIHDTTYEHSVVGGNKVRFHRRT